MYENLNPLPSSSWWPSALT